MPHISVIVPAYNSGEHIEECLRAIKGSFYKDFELIVVDDGSGDTTRAIAKKYADTVVVHERNLGRGDARNNGLKLTHGEIVVNIDSDIVVEKDTLNKIADYFCGHPEVDALTGLLSLKHPNNNFLSQYKNLYMHYIFERLPERVNFLYASICAFRRPALQPYNPEYRSGIDTELGQRLRSHGRQIAFLRDLEVMHLKKYSPASFIKNDFQVPFYWARIFCAYRGWRQIGRDRTGFGHSPSSQLAGVALASLIPCFFFAGLLSGRSHLLPISLLAGSWFALNIGFLSFLVRQKNVFFGVESAFLTLFDNMIMALGIISGFVSVLTVRKKR